MAFGFFSSPCDCSGYSHRLFVVGKYFDKLIELFAPGLFVEDFSCLCIARKDKLHRMREKMFLA